jgi:hypothetical protein
VLSHIGCKVFKYLPTLANTDSMGTVPFKIRLFRIFAALAHCPPSLPESSAALVVSALTMLGPSGGRNFLPQAPARTRVATKQFVGANDFKLSAIAVAQPIGVPCASPVKTFDQQSSVTLAFSIFCFYAHLCPRHL